MSDSVVAETVSVHYGRHRALAGVSCRFPEGAVTVLLGPNGSGKSSLLGAIAGLVPHSGRLTVLGRPAGRGPVRVAVVPQAARFNDAVALSVRAVARMGRYAERGALRRLRPVDHEIVDEALDRLELGPLADRPVRELSGGQRQRVLIAQALAQRAPVLILDEATRGLDRESRRRLVEVVRAERADGRTILLASHDRADLELADQAVLLDGRLVAQGRPADVTDDARRARAFVAHS